MDELSMKWVTEPIASAGGLLLGRRTYEIFAAYWPTAPEEVQVVAEPLNRMPKYVASRTLSEPLEWQNSSLLKGDVAAAVQDLKQGDGPDILVIGSLELVQTLIANDLIDEYKLMIDPLVLGGGKRLFADDGALRKLRLVESDVTSTGAILTLYAPATA
jgi:dihydrofolate reductase